MRRDHFAKRRYKDSLGFVRDYPARKNGSPAKEVVEIVVKFKIPDISKHVVWVRRMRGAETIGELAI